MTPVVELQGLVKRYGGRTVVDGVSFSVVPGERLALLGHNGAGKTTLMKMMLGLVRPSAGHARVLGQEPGAVRRAVGFLPETIAFHHAMTGWETLRFYARLKGRRAAECRDLLERVGLTEAAGRRVGTYSKGMRQRLGLAQALLGEPQLLLLDEPTTGLDPELRQRFHAIVRDLKEAGAAVLLSSHLLTELEERTDRIAIMDRGRLVALGTLDELRVAADLPVRFRVRVVEGGAEALAHRLGNQALAEPEDGDLVTFACAPVWKMEVLRAVAELNGAVRDLDIQPPTLDDIYAHFTGAPAEAEP